MNTVYLKMTFAPSEGETTCKGPLKSPDVKWLAEYLNLVHGKRQAVKIEWIDSDEDLRMRTRSMQTEE